MPGITIKDFTADELRRIAKVLLDYSGELDKFADEMKAEGIEQISIRGVGELQRAEDRIGVFCDNARTSMRRARRPKMFGDEPAEEVAPARRTRAAKKRPKKTK